MDIIRELLKTTRGKLLIFGGIIIIVVLGIIIWFITNRTAPSPEESITYLEDPSGATLYYTNANQKAVP